MAPPLRAQAANHWIYIDSAETENGPFLHVELADGGELAIPAERDTVLIEYLADRVWAGLPRLSIDKQDKNRSLIRFAVPAGIAVQRAELRATAHPGQLAPLGDTTFRIHRVLASWGDDASWERAPRLHAEELTVVTVPHGGGPLAVELTELVAAWAADPDSNHGVALRVLADEGAPKVAAPANPRGFRADLTGRIRTCIPWRSAVADALAEAKKSGKLVLTFAVADRFQQLANAHERAFAATTLLDPAVRALIEERFVPLRLSTNPAAHMGPKARPDDPLAGLGTDGVQAKAPALVVSSAAGERIAVLASIGTWDRDLIVGFLLHALAGRPAPDGLDAEAALAAGYVERARQLFEKREGTDAVRGRLRVAAFTGAHRDVLGASDALAEAGALTDADRLATARSLLAMGRPDPIEELLAETAGPAARYWRGVAAARRDQPDRARSLWNDVAVAAGDDARWGLRARLRSLWSDAIDELQPASAVSFSAGMTSTEVARPGDPQALVAQALDHLLARQKRDGRWAHPGYPMYDDAVTSLCAKALVQWLADAPDGRRERMVDALACADAWCAGYLKRADTETANSFGAVYLLDYLLERAPDVAAARSLVPAAIELLMGGQMDNGAWSYSRQFGQGWRGGFGGWAETDKGRAHSINTGMALWALARCKRDGFEIPEAKVAAGVAALEEMKETATTFTYTWPEPRTFDKPDQSIGKAAVCLQALVALEARPRADLEAALAEFMRWRGGLRATVKLTASWMGPSGTSSYFFLHACYHAAEAIAFCGGAEQDERLRALRDDLLAVAEVDGTWVDYEESGKTYGTAMALLVLARAR